MGDLPLVLAVATDEGSHGKHFYGTSFDPKGLSLHECLGNFFAGGLDNAGKGLAGHIHALGGLLLVQAFQVGQAHGFQFIQPQKDFMEVGRGATGGYEPAAGRMNSNPAASARSGHG